MFLFFDRSRSRLLTERKTRPKAITERKTRPKAIEDQATIMLECAKTFFIFSPTGVDSFFPLIIQLTNRLENK